MKLTRAEQGELLGIARTSIEHALMLGGYVAPPALDVAHALSTLRSSFVTLHVDCELRGCCGTLEAQRPLAEDVWMNAYASSHRDPRFAPLTRGEWRRTEVHISVLTTPTPVIVADERELLSQLRPGVDGLILQLGPSRATFLPSVWEQIDDPATFLRHLKRKAGWSADFWSPQIEVQRYESESFGEQRFSRPPTVAQAPRLER